MSKFQHIADILEYYQSMEDNDLMIEGVPEECPFDYLDDDEDEVF